MATKHALSGFVQNRSDGVIVEVEGAAWTIDSFLSGINEEFPPAIAMIHKKGPYLVKRLSNETDTAFRSYEKRSQGPAKFAYHAG